MARILVVDDEPDLRRLLGLMLRLAGHDVAEAAHGQAALDYLAANQLPNLVITDAQMPVMDGPTLIERLRATCATRRLPVLMLSAHPPAGIGVPVMRKPFDANELATLVQHLCDGGGEA